MQEEIKFLTEAYDFQEVIEKDLAPLVSQIHAICQERKIPYICAIAAMCNPEQNEHIVNGSALLVGSERTPPELVLANIAIQKNIPEAIKFGSLCLMNGLTAEQCGEENEEEFADGPRPTVKGHGHA